MTLYVFKVLRYESVDAYQMPAGGGVSAASPQPQGRHRLAVKEMASVTAVTQMAYLGPGPAGHDGDLFIRNVRDYASRQAGQPVTVLQAGCTSAGGYP